MSTISSRSEKNQRGFSVIEILVVVAALTVISVIAVPQLLPSKKAAQEASAVASTRTLMNAQVAYASTVGAGQFASLPELESAGLVDSALANGNKDGYEFTVSAKGGQGFEVVAVPLENDGTIQRSFYGDQTGVIRHSLGAPPGPGSPALGGGSDAQGGLIDF